MTLNNSKSIMVYLTVAFVLTIGSWELERHYYPEVYEPDQDFVEFSQHITPFTFVFPTLLIVFFVLFGPVPIVAFPKEKQNGG